MIKNKVLILTTAIVLFSCSLYSQGFFTNPVQSSAAVRMLARDATLGPDAAYYNPAGTIMLGDGLHLLISYQPNFDNQSIKNNYEYLKQNSYTGTGYNITVPSIYLVYNDRRFSISGNINMYSNGGYINYNDGLPFMELSVANLIPCLDTIQFPYNGGIVADPVDYQINEFSFSKESYYYGGQLNMAYKIFKNLSISAGARYVVAYEYFTGYKRGMELLIATGTNQLWINARTMITSRAGEYGTLANYYYDIDDTVSGDIYSGLQSDLSSRSRMYSDQKLKSKRKGNGWTPIIGLDAMLLNGKLNIGFKYEFRTKLVLTNETDNDLTLDYITDENGVSIRTTLFDNNGTARNDIPALLSGGFSYKPIEKIQIAGGMRYYFYKDVNWSGREEDIEKDMIEYSFGAEYKPFKKILVSAGFMHNSTPVKDSFQKNYSFHMPGNTFGFGVGYEVINKLIIDVGCAYTKYNKTSYTHDYTYDNNALMNVTDTYNRNIWYIGIGLSYSVKTKYDIY